MAEKSVEERIKSLEHEIKRLKAVNEVQNLMGRYEAIHNPTDMHRSWELFAQHTPDTWMEISDWGMFKGIEEIKRVWTSNRRELSQVGGMVFEHHLATPIIEVAEDCQTVKATWCSPGYETHRSAEEREALWCWGKYGIDFIKEDGEWKFWHFKWFRTFMIPYHQSWVEAPLMPTMRRDFGKPSTYHHPYTPDSVAVSIPPAPRPYKKWTDEDKRWQFRAAENP